ncbi:MAG TPA: phage tail family protein [Bacillota bacterium]|nr:phage tail family protein [Bacillota bacterium]HPZ55604.1 phage tail family protein [Bacillota bacterium]
MRVKVINALGEVMLLPEELALQGWPMEADLPGVEIGGHDGQVIDAGMIRLKPRDVRVTGTLQGLSKDDADRTREMVAGFVYRANPLKLYRHELSERYMLVYAESIDHAYITGRYGGRLFNLNIGFRAAEPFLLGTDQSVTITTASVDVNNPGTAPVSPVVTISGAITNPVITNTTTGQTLALTLALAAGESVVVDCERFTAAKGGVGVVGALDDTFLTGGFSLAPGVNAITVAGTGAPNAQIAWTPRYY